MKKFDLIDQLDKLDLVHSELAYFYHYCFENWYPLENTHLQRVIHDCLCQHTQETPFHLFVNLT